MEFNIECESLKVSPFNDYYVRVIFEADIDNVLYNISAEEAISHFGEDDILEIIGLDKVKEYFGIE
jgi:hypothetical protein